MIKIKLQSFAKKNQKNISEIARETGLNRNTITALYHEKIDGIKFDTLERICSKYKIRVEDIVEYVSSDAKNLVELQRKQTYYKQEGEAVPLPMWPIFMIFNRFPKKYFDFQFRGGSVFFKKDYAEWYWSLDGMNDGARSFYKVYNDKKKLKLLYQEFQKNSDVLENYYNNFDSNKIHNLSDKELIFEFSKIDKILQEFWRVCLFIDCFDPGFDQLEIKKIAERYGLGLDEVGVLTTPLETTFNNDAHLYFLKIIKDFIYSKSRKTEGNIREFLEKNDKIERYIKKFNYIKTNYAKSEEILLEEIIEEIQKYSKDKKLFNLELERLQDYSIDQKKKEKNILESHGLSNNPLWFFQKLTFWREQKKI